MDVQGSALGLLLHHEGSCDGAPGDGGEMVSPPCLQTHLGAIPGCALCSHQARGKSLSFTMMHFKDSFGSWGKSSSQLSQGPLVLLPNLPPASVCKSETLFLVFQKCDPAQELLLPQIRTAQAPIRGALYQLCTFHGAMPKTQISRKPFKVTPLQPCQDITNKAPTEHF